MSTSLAINDIQIKIKMKYTRQFDIKESLTFQMFENNECFVFLLVVVEIDTIFWEKWHFISP